MHMPVQREHKRRIGLTGDLRTRQQWFTKRHILQVAVLYEVKVFRHPKDLTDPNWPSKRIVEWEDAEAATVLRITCGLPPFERKRSVKASLPPTPDKWPTGSGHAATSRCPSCCYDECQCELHWGRGNERLL